MPWQVVFLVPLWWFLLSLSAFSVISDLFGGVAKSLLLGPLLFHCLSTLWSPSFKQMVFNLLADDLNLYP